MLANGAKSDQSGQSGGEQCAWRTSDASAPPLRLRPLCLVLRRGRRRHQRRRSPLGHWCRCLRLWIRFRRRRIIRRRRITRGRSIRRRRMASRRQEAPARLAAQDDLNSDVSDSFVAIEISQTLAGLDWVCD